MTLAPLRVLEARAKAARSTLRSAIVAAVLNPILYLLVMGLGVGSLVDPEAAASLAGGSYLAFLAPGLLVANAMNISAAESTWPVMVGAEWERTYHAITATPLGPRDVVFGHIGWVLVRVTLAAAIMAVLIVIMGLASVAGAMLAVGAAVLVGGAFAGLVTAFTLVVRKGEALTTLMRFAVVPLFLFSGTFFPVDRLPDAAKPVVALSPLWHGAELARAGALGVSSSWPPAVHVAVLLGVMAVSLPVAVRALRGVVRV